MARAIFGGGKKKAAPAPAEQKGPIVKPLAQDTDLLARLKRNPAPLVPALLGGDTILGSKLGG